MLKLESLRGAELFLGLTGEQLSRFYALASPRTFKQGEWLFRLGDEANCIFVISAGTIDLTVPLRVLGEVKDVIFDVLGVCRTVAWSALVPPYRLTMGARAATDAELVSLPRDGLQKLFESDPRIGLTVMTNVARVVGNRLHEAQALWVREALRNVAQTYR